MRPLVIDNFAGGGGASTGIEQALGIVDIAINHDAEAIAGSGGWSLEQLARRHPGSTLQELRRHQVVLPIRGRGPALPTSQLAGRQRI